ncbi:MAG: MFS transporter [Actinobacteria bacterium]|nr:MFS transporter [Actinomycetota bacterium]
MSERELRFGIRENLVQVTHQLIQVLLVGFAIGMTRTVVPALAESEFGLARGSFLLLSSFVVAFGVVKAAMNFVAGRWSERIGRKRVLFWGWVAALPIPIILWQAQDWSWIVVATLLLGINQGLCWSMTQTAKLDVTRADERGLTMGLNEFSGYLGVAIAGILTAYAATWLGPRTGLLAFGMVVVVTALVLTIVWVRDTLPWAEAESAAHRTGLTTYRSRYAQSSSESPSTSEVFVLMSWRDRRLFAISQAGMVEKFVDALVWVAFPAFLIGQGVALTEVGWIVGVYGFVWGGTQLVTGRLSDRLGRHWLNVSGMWVCGAGVALAMLGSGPLWWSLAAGITGLGMALLYPNLSAAVADITPPAWRGSAIGIYRFWRDLGYAIGALGLGLAAHFTGELQAAFWLVAISMIVSGIILLWLGEETHPRLNPAQQSESSLA